MAKGLFLDSVIIRLYFIAYPALVYFSDLFFNQIIQLLEKKLVKGTSSHRLVTYVRSNQC